MAAANSSSDNAPDVCKSASFFNSSDARGGGATIAAAANAKLTPEDRKRICAKARAVRLLKREAMTQAEREAEHLRRVEAIKRGHETRRRKAAEAAEKLERSDNQA